MYVCMYVCMAVNGVYDSILNLCGVCVYNI